MVIVEISWLVILLLSLLSSLVRFRMIGGLPTHLAVRTLFDCCRWSGRVTQAVQRTSLWPASWLPAVDEGRGSKSVEFRRVWEIYDERLQFISRQDALQLDESP